MKLILTLFLLIGCADNIVNTKNTPIPVRQGLITEWHQSNDTLYIEPQFQFVIYPIKSDIIFIEIYENGYVVYATDVIRINNKFFIVLKEKIRIQIVLSYGYSL